VAETRRTARVIRRATADDAAALLALWERAHSTPSTTDNAAAVTRVIETPAARVFVAEEDGVIVGSIIATFDGWRANVYRMAVDPGHRRQGIALELAGRATEWFREVDARRVTALVEADRPEAQAFWSAAGFAWQDGMRRYVMTLRNIG
jgi:ribosomal protein S18 acetylase RimI-like enzyme